MEFTFILSQDVNNVEVTNKVLIGNIIFVVFTSVIGGRGEGVNDLTIVSYNVSIA